MVGYLFIHAMPFLKHFEKAMRSRNFREPSDQFVGKRPLSVKSADLIKFQ